MKSSSVAVLLLALGILSASAQAPGGRVAKEQILQKQAQAAKPARTWVDDLLVSPVGVIRTADISGDSDWGLGVDLALPMNKFVSLHLVNLTYGDHDWRTSAIDETGLNIEAKLTRFATESFTPYALGGVTRSWSREDWSFAAGLGAKYRLSKSLHLGADYSLRAWFDSEKDGLTRGYMQFSF